MRCPSCGAKCRSNRVRCPRCGVPLDPKVAAFGGAARGVREAWGLEAQVETAVEPRRDATRYAAFAAVALILVAGSLTVALLVNRSSGPGRERPLDAENFADASLVSVLAPYDADGDGTLSPAEASLVTDLDCSGMGLRSLAGIELCVNLRSLDASGNSLTAVDLTELGALEHADLSDNALSSLDVSGHGALSTLDVTDNGMTSLDVSGCAALQSLSCAGNELARLDLSDCDSLTSLWCDEGQNVTVPIAEGFFPDAGLRATLAAVADADGDGALTLRERQNLTSLTVDDPSTASFYGLAWFENLAELAAAGCSLTELDASELPASLTSVDASDCQISSVNLAGLERLAALNLSGNPLSSIDLAGLERLESLDLSDCSLTGTLDVTGNPRLELLDATGNPGLDRVEAAGVPGLAAPGAVQVDAGCEVATGAPAGDPGAADAAGEPDGAQADEAQVSEAQGAETQVEPTTADETAAGSEDATSVAAPSAAE